MTTKRGVIALDVGGTKIACGLVTENGEVLFHKSEPTGQQSTDASLAQLVSLIEEGIRACPANLTVGAVGLVVPGWVNHKTHTVWAPNIAGWDQISLEYLLQRKIPLPIILDSDRSGHVMGEAWLGVARGLKDVVFLAVGTGIGAGILVNGEILHGHEDLAGAVGWMALNPEFHPIYARMGCFESEASGNSVGRKGIVALAADDSVRTETGITARQVLAAALAGHPKAGEVLAELTLYLGMGVANLVSTLNPAMVVLGGGLFQAGTPLLDMVRKEFTRWAQPFAAQSVRIELSVLGDRAGLLGAARIAFDNI